MSQTDKQKLIQILGALDLPRGHYVVLGPASIVLDPELHGEDQDCDRLDILVDTALWFQLYESTVSGIVWTLCLPDPQDAATRVEPPHLEYELLGIKICAGFALPDHRDSHIKYMEQALFADAEIYEGFPVYPNGYRGAQWRTSQ